VVVVVVVGGGGGLVVVVVVVVIVVREVAKAYLRCIKILYLSYTTYLLLQDVKHYCTLHESLKMFCLYSYDAAHTIFVLSLSSSSYH